MDLEIDYEITLQIVLSSLIGAVIGFEREYHSKAAGLRTMIMICLGSTIFTQVSLVIGIASPDRVASNIITGIGFLGAGVIFKDGLSISGITTATTIWICAALGMAVGSGEYFIAMLGSVIVILILSALANITERIERFHQARSYRITFHNNDNFEVRFENEVRRTGLKYFKKKDFKNSDYNVVLYEIFGGEKKLKNINDFLKQDPSVKSYEY